MKNKVMKKSQVALFVIIALGIVAVIILAFLYRGSSFTTLKQIDPASFVSECLKDSLIDSEKELLESNGYPNKADNYIIHYGRKVPYLCKSSEFYKQCINQEPALIEYFRSEFVKRAANDSDLCFKQLADNLNRQGYSVKEIGNAANRSTKIRFEGASIIVDVKRTIATFKNDESKVYESFTAKINSPLYRLVNTARNIVNFEAVMCEFNAVNWMKYYPDISITKFMTGDNTKIYTLEDRDTSKKFEFAIKTCSLPAGI